MSTKSKTRIYKSCIRPVLTYAETRAETSQTKRMIRATEIKILRPIKGVTLRDRIRSDTILRELEAGRKMDKSKTLLLERLCR